MKHLRHLLLASVFHLSIGVLRLAAADNTTTVTSYPVPPELLSDRYTVRVNGQNVPVLHAALNIHLVQFDFTGRAEVSVTAKGDLGEFYWEESAVIRPLSRGIKATTDNMTTRFSLTAPAQLSLERPPRIRATDEVLFVFANAPEQDIPRHDDPKTIHLGPGIHRRNVDLASGQTLYLHGGAVLWGSVNVWDADHVRILGRGVILHEGPQSKEQDEGSRHVRNWHPLATHNVRDLIVKGVVLVGRSRTWTIQTWNTTDALFENIKIIGACPQNINNDGIDWFGGGRARVRDCFLRTTDDAFAFYHDRNSGQEVSDITVERCVFWLTRASLYRLGWDGQDLVTRGIVTRDSDIIHMGVGHYIAPHALLCSVVRKGTGGQARHSDYVFEDIRIEEPATLIGIDHPTAKFQNIVFRNIRLSQGLAATNQIITAMDGLVFENVRVKDRVAESENDLPLNIKGGRKPSFVRRSALPENADR